MKETLFVELRFKCLRPLNSTPWGHRYALQGHASLNTSHLSILECKSCCRDVQDVSHPVETLKHEGHRDTELQAL